MVVRLLWLFIVGFVLKLDFKKVKNGGEIKLNNSGRQKKGKNTKQKQTPSRNSLKQSWIIDTREKLQPRALD